MLWAPNMCQALREAEEMELNKKWPLLSRGTVSMWKKELYLQYRVKIVTIERETWSYGRCDIMIYSKKNGEGNGTPFQYSCLENPMDGWAWWAAVHGVAKSRTRLSDFTFTFHFHALEKEMAPHSSVVAWRIPGTGSLVGCRLWGRTESDTTEAT